MYMCIYIYIYTYAIMKTMCPPGYHHNGFVATHALLLLWDLNALCIVDHLWLIILCSLLNLLSTFGSLVLAMCNRTSCAQVHELSQSHCGINRKGTLFSWSHIYYAHLAFVRFKHSVCRGSLMTNYNYIIHEIRWNYGILRSVWFTYIKTKNISPDHRYIPRLQRRVVSIAENYFQEMFWY